MIKPGRTPCCIPFCGRTFKTEHEGEEIICGKHWRLLPATMKARRRQLRRRLDRIERRGRKLEREGKIRAARKAYRAHTTARDQWIDLWNRMKVFITESEAGIS
jgi:hypothetical protein